MTEPEPPPTNEQATDGDEQVTDQEQAFRFSYSDGLCQALARLNITLWVSTYQAGKLAVFHVKDERLSMLPRTFDKAMGFALDHRRLAIGTRYQVWQINNKGCCVLKSVALKRSDSRDLDSYREGRDETSIARNRLFELLA